MDGRIRGRNDKDPGEGETAMIDIVCPEDGSSTQA